MSPLSTWRVHNCKLRTLSQAILFSVDRAYHKSLRPSVLEQSAHDRSGVAPLFDPANFPGSTPFPVQFGRQCIYSKNSAAEFDNTACGTIKLKQCIHFIILEAGIRYSASHFGTFSFNLVIARDIRRSRDIWLAVQQFRHILSNFGIEIFQQFAYFFNINRYIAHNILIYCNN